MSFNVAMLEAMQAEGLDLAACIRVLSAGEVVQEDALLTASRQRTAAYRERLGMTDRQWKKLRMEVFKRDSFTCQYCEATKVPLSCDHVIPLIQGGSNDIDNLKTACIPCNSGKGGRTPEEWQA